MTSATIKVGDVGVVVTLVANDAQDETTCEVHITGLSQCGLGKIVQILTEGTGMDKVRSMVDKAYGQVPFSLKVK